LYNGGVLRSTRILATAACALLVLAAASDVAAAPTLSKPQFKRRANAICASAHAKVLRVAPLYPIARTAKIGDKWLKIDRDALAALRAITPPASERARVRRLLALTDKTINTGLADLVKAAKAGNKSKYNSASRRFTTLLIASHKAAGDYGLPACFSW